MNPQIFEYIDSGRLDELGKFSQEQLRPFIPLLARSGLLFPFESIEKTFEVAQSLLYNLLQHEAANNIVSLLSIDYKPLEMDVKKELQLR